jgi:hypothetical protein
MHADLNSWHPEQRSVEGQTTPTDKRCRAEVVELVRAALSAEYAALASSPLCDLPGVVSLARRQYAHKLYPAASALRALLTHAYTEALNELDGVDDRRSQRVATYLRLARDGMPVTGITQRLGLRSTSYAHHTIQRRAIELVTEAFVRRACRPDDDDLDGHGPIPHRSLELRDTASQ